VNVFHEVVATLPSWLVVGGLLGVAGSLLAVLAFLSADRLIPGEERSQRHHGSGESRRRVEFREHLDAIGESYVENHPVDGQPVAFYLPARDVAITFDPRAYYRIRPTGTVAILAEHEMPGSVLVDRLPFETPEVSFDDGASGDGGQDWDNGRDRDGDADPARAAFDELGVPATASVEEVRRAYRRRVKEVHPDQGGDEDEFKRVREAYTIARNHRE
jgi:hypothetical protein